MKMTRPSKISYLALTLFLNFFQFGCAEKATNASNIAVEGKTLSVVASTEKDLRLKTSSAEAVAFNVEFLSALDSWYVLNLATVGGNGTATLTKQYINHKNVVLRESVITDTTTSLPFYLKVDEKLTITLTPDVVGTEFVESLRTQSGNPEVSYLAKASGCLACHAYYNVVVGPAWADITTRYAGIVDAKTHLIAKVATGGRGNWGDATQGISMPPYSPRVTDDNIALLVDSILRLPEQILPHTDPAAILTPTPTPAPDFARYSNLTLHNLTKDDTLKYTFAPPKSSTYKVDTSIAGGDGNMTVTKEANGVTTTVADKPLLSATPKTTQEIDMQTGNHYVFEMKSNSKSSVSLQIAGPLPPVPDLSVSTTDLNLFKKSGCLACHAVDKTIIGPAFYHVAMIYKNDTGARARLIEKVKTGGKGNWTDVTGGVAMPPYSPRVPDSDIAALVDFILGLAN